MASRRRKTVETVKSQGAWCCISQPLASSSPIARSYRTPASEALKFQKKTHKFEEKGNHNSGSQISKSLPAQSTTKQQHEVVVNKLEKLKKSGDVGKDAGEVLKTGEIAALIKHGFIGGGNLDKPGNSSPFKSLLTAGRVSPMVEASALPLSSASPPNYSNLKSFLSTGVMNQPSPPFDRKRPSPTLYDMMVHDQEAQDTALQHPLMDGNPKHSSLQNRTLSAFSPETQFNEPTSCDLKLTLKNKEGLSITINAHSQILATHSRFFAAKLAEMLCQEHCELPHLIEISDCEDVEIYVETLRLMYSEDMKRKLVKESVLRVLGILKVCAGIVFESGVFSCLEYLEAVPWAEEDEEKVTALLTELHLENIGAGEVLQRLSTDDPTGSDDVLVSLLHLVTKGTDEKARREMKGLVSRMLRENTAQGRDVNDLSIDSLYESCHGCVDSLLDLFMQASSPDIVGRLSEERAMLIVQITRHADNLNWLVDIMIDRQIADEFVRVWAFQTELATLHRQVPIIFGRYEVSRLTARLCVALGKGQVLAPKEVRFMLMQNWLQPLIDDFGWMQRACKGLDRKVVEEGISQTILTLPLKQQQMIMVAWFDRFLKNGDDCPNLQRAFEIWWRRTFVRPAVVLVLSPDVRP